VQTGSDAFIVIELCKFGLNRCRILSNWPSFIGTNSFYINIQPAG